ncbi:J domain-containing protein [Rhodotorula paludigena]|uniref:J domain-containing protein n=1 Tax=Rhodotorula paludigena TaxID=86838 RepID=UPI0031806E95
MSSAPGSLYALLSLAPSAAADEVRSAYLRLAKAHHPDRAPPEQREQATRDFQELARAYKTLSDPELRKAYDRRLGLDSSAPAPLSQPPPPLPRRPRSPSSSFAPSPTAYQHRYEHPAPDSPFPGFRVPPGGFPADPLPFSASALPAVDLGGFVAAPRRSREKSWSARPPRAAYSPAAAPAHGFAVPALAAEDPFALFRRVLDEQERFLRDAFSRSEVEGGGGMRCEGRGVVRRREWNEGRREANGDAILFQGLEEVEPGADGGIRWRGESTTIAYTTRRSAVRHLPRIIRCLLPLSQRLSL